MVMTDSEKEKKREIELDLSLSQLSKNLRFSLFLEASMPMTGYY